MQVLKETFVNPTVKPQRVQERAPGIHYAKEAPEGGKVRIRALYTNTPGCRSFFICLHYTFLRLNANTCKKEGVRGIQTLALVSKRRIAKLDNVQGVPIH